MDHVTTEEILSYLSETLEEERRFHLETHLADCSHCVARVHSYRRLRKNFDELWDSWTARKHGEAVLQAHLAKSLEEAAADPTRMERLRPWGQRLHDWVARLSRKTLLAVGVLLDSSRQAAQVLQEGLADLCPPGIFPLEPVLAPSRVLGPGVGPGAPTVVATPGPPPMKVTIEPARKKVTVQTGLLAPPLPLVILVPKGPGPALIEELRHPPQADFLLAEFTGVEGEYFLFLEAVDQPDV